MLHITEVHSHEGYKLITHGEKPLWWVRPHTHTHTLTDTHTPTGTHTHTHTTHTHTHTHTHRRTHTHTHTQTHRHTHTPHTHRQMCRKYTKLTQHDTHKICTTHPYYL